jgi:hypothetical protein
MPAIYYYFHPALQAYSLANLFDVAINYRRLPIIPCTEVKLATVDASANILNLISSQ